MRRGARFRLASSFSFFFFSFFAGRKGGHIARLTSRQGRRGPRQKRNSKKTWSPLRAACSPFNTRKIYQKYQNLKARPRDSSLGRAYDTLALVGCEHSTHWTCAAGPSVPHVHSTVRPKVSDHTGKEGIQVKFATGTRCLCRVPDPIPSTSSRLYSVRTACMC
ncbi:hypothetical protein BDY21DRAFT_351125 [Lineolata rhizophorae]|uniref:Secreted protein n=1 Tax=Lineolata rhizophorae TaxID=578093 RepID=A0A6A6NUH1_9PEZI|nr:hypothetical protein BDY21DRAFT_351125 [Lineolata rhizophorae]